MLKSFLSFIPLLGTSIGAFLGTMSNSDRCEEQEHNLLSVAAGILCSITLNLFLETVENIRYILLFVGILIGFLLTILINLFTNKNNLNIKSKLFLAMLIHNIPEGIITGISLAYTSVMPTFVSLMSISLQNIPDGFVVTTPLVYARGKKLALLLGIFSGIIEPLISVLIIFTAGKVANIETFIPFLIGFSFSIIFMLTIELLRECKNLKLATFTAVVTILFYSILS